MQGRNFTFRIPQALDECLPERLTQLEMEKLAQYLVSLICYDLSIAKPHYTTGDFHNLPGPIKDKIFDEIARAFKSGESLGGSLFEARIKAATEEAGMPEVPPASTVGRNIQRRLAKSK